MFFERMSRCVKKLSSRSYSTEAVYSIWNAVDGLKIVSRYYQKRCKEARISISEKNLVLLCLKTVISNI